MPLRVAWDREARNRAAGLSRISGQNPHACLQCGMCTGACPYAAEMDLNPRAALHLLQLGLLDRLAQANTAWVCASCLSCQVVCPRGIDLPRIMEALRLNVLRRENIRLDPAAISPQTLRQAPPIALVSALRKLSY